MVEITFNAHWIDALTIICAIRSTADDFEELNDRVHNGEDGNLEHKVEALRRIANDIAKCIAVELEKNLT
ncbi:MAG: hypothetical protein OCU12_06235 [Methanophagales archaeon]|nr:hypothetical protein [Methanophagales archaeon]